MSSYLKQEVRKRIKNKSKESRKNKLKIIY